MSIETMKLTDPHDHPEPHTMKWTQLEMDYINKRVEAAVRAAIKQAEKQRLDDRTLIRIRQAAWREVRLEYKDDSECCFALGFDAGYGAVALRVESPEMEGGGGFESLPASPIAWITFTAYGEEDDIWYENPEGNLPEGWTYKPLYITPPQREWVGLTDEELVPIYAEYKSPRNIYLAIESALRNKNT